MREKATISAGREGTLAKERMKTLIKPAALLARTPLYAFVDVNVGLKS